MPTIEKPFRPASLRAVVEAMLARTRSSGDPGGDTPPLSENVA
jgi:hypothetical protein